MTNTLKQVLRRLPFQEWENWTPILLIEAFGFLALLSWLGVIQFDILPTDIEKAYRAYVEIGVAATGAIFAIVITLSLVAIQFASQEYSHRIMNAYIRSVMFWATMCVYLGVMGVNIVAAMNLNEPFDTRMVGVSILGSILCLVLLVPHFLITAAYLKPDFVIGKLLKRIDTEYLTTVQKSIQRRTGFPPSNIDRLLPVVEMVERSIDKGDLTTTRTALELIQEQYTRDVAARKDAATDRFYLNYLLRLGHKAVLAMDEESTAVHVVSILGDLGASGPDTLAAEHIANLGSLAFKRDSDRVVDQVIDSLRQVFTATTRDETRDTVLASYEELVVRLSSSDKERQVRHLTTVLYELARESLVHRAAPLALRFVEFLERIGRTAATEKRQTVVSQTVEAVQSLGTAAAYHPETAERIITVLLRIERDISPTERELRSATEYARGAIQYAVTQARRAAAATVPAAPGPAADALAGSARDGAAPRGKEVAPRSEDGTSDGHGASLDQAPAALPPATTASEEEMDLSDLWGAKTEDGASPHEEKPAGKPAATPSQQDPFGGLDDLWGSKKEG